MPLANAYLDSAIDAAEERAYPLAVTACPQCGLVQLTYVVPPDELYRQYPYVSSTADSLRRYAERFATQLMARHQWGPSDLLLEIGSNDGLVLKAFQRHGIQVLGVEPATNIAAIAQRDGVPTRNVFFAGEATRRLAREVGNASAILGRHVLAHIDDWHDFFRGVDSLLAPDGVVTW